MLSTKKVLTILRDELPSNKQLSIYKQVTTEARFAYHFNVWGSAYEAVIWTRLVDPIINFHSLDINHVDL